MSWLEVGFDWVVCGSRSGVSVAMAEKSQVSFLAAQMPVGGVEAGVLAAVRSLI